MIDPRVLIADDHAMTRAGVRAALDGRGFRVIAEAADGAAALEAALRERPDVCLLDVHMPAGGGIVAARAIVDRLPGTVVVMLTVSRDDDDLFESLRAGAVGYLLKDTDPDRLPNALRGVLQGEAALPRTLMARVLEEFRTRQKRRRLPLMRAAGAELSDREWDVLERLRAGETTKEIAAALAISEVTVRRHVSGVLAKLQVPDRKAALSLLESLEEELDGGDGDGDGQAA